MAISIGGSIRTIPIDYKNIEYYIDESLPLAKYPTCSWSADAYTNWLTQNAVNNTTFIAQKAFDATALIATGQVPAGIFTIGDMAHKIISDGYQQSLQPSIQGGQNTGDVNYSSGNNTFVYRQMRLKAEYMKQVDDYFTRFGYKIARVILPNITGRRYWNYVEIGSSEEVGHGNIPSNHLEIINKTFRRGVTIWHSHENIGNYNLDNSIVS
jgi:hypothetical protein